METKRLDYRDGTVRLEGFLADDEKRAGMGPGIVVFPDARGLGEHAMERARRLAALGYTVLAADLYGDGVQAGDLAHALELMRGLRSDMMRWRARAGAALDALSRQEKVDRAKLAAIGYCFGGSTALELARSGAKLAGVVSFHGGLDSLQPDDARHIKAKILVCHGAMDPLVPPEQVAAFEAEMRKTDVDWQVHTYGGTVHAFTNPDAGSADLPAFAYNAAADRRSWSAMLGLFEEIF
jgi:dienelactone hydrolase